MTDDTLPLEDVFNPAAPDEEMELGGLTASLRLAQGFTLLFARCNQPDQRRRLVATIRERLPHLNIQEIELREPIPHLLDELRYEIAEPVPDVIFVSGLEYSLPVAAQAANTAFVLNLNASRNSFSRYIPCPLVLWMPEYVLTAIMNGAPDFFSVRSGVYFFASNFDEMQSSIQSILADNDLAVANMPLEQKRERLHTVLNMFEEYSQLETSTQNLQSRFNLMIRAAHLYFVMGQLEQAAQAYNICLSLCDLRKNEVGRGVVLPSLGNVYVRQEKWNEAIKCFMEGFKIAERVGDWAGQAISLTSLAGIHARQNNWPNAEKSYNRALSLLPEKEVRLRAIILSNLGNMFNIQQHWHEAEQHYQQARTMFEVQHDYANLAYLFNSLGAMYARQNRWAEAEQIFLQSLPIKRRLGDVAGEGATLSNLALLNANRGDLQKALELERQALNLLSHTEDIAETQKVQSRIVELEQRLNAVPTAS